MLHVSLSAFNFEIVNFIKYHLSHVLFILVVVVATQLAIYKSMFADTTLNDTQ